MTTLTMPLNQRWAEFKSQNPKVRIRDAAHQLGVSEAELVAAGVGETAVRLQGDFRELLKQVPTLGYVMALTRNDYIVHERKGEYQKVSFTNHVGLVLGPDIDLRLFMTHWQFGFAVNENDRKSLQFFDTDGTAVHKIYLNERSNETAYDALVDKYRAAEQSTELTTQPVPAQDEDKKDEEIDVPGFQEAWLQMKDTHEFFGILKKYSVGRQQGLRLAPAGYAERLTVDQLKKAFERVAEREVPIMIFASSPGCIQIHTGPVKKLVTMGPWYNVLDPEFNMHLREDQIAQVWLTRKPTEDGVVTSLELFAANGDNIALIFGQRKPGKPELESWREVVRELVD